MAIDRKTLDARIARLGFSAQVAEKIRSSKRCFIIGMGPSISKVDAAALRDELVIGVNYILRTPFVPDIICTTDPSRLDTENLGPDSPRLITARHIYTHHAEYLSNVNHFHDIDFLPLSRSVMTVDAFDPQLKRIYWTGSVVGDLAIPLATHLGIEEVYLLGLDGARASFPSTHIWGNETSAFGPHDSRLFHQYERAGQLALKDGTKVYNASFGGVVAAFDKVDLRKVIPQAVRTRFEGELEGRFIVFNGHILRITACDRIPGTWRFVTHDGARMLRHRKRKAFVDKVSDEPDLLALSRFHIEPSFVRADWISLRCHTPEDQYVIRWDAHNPYWIREVHDIFSGYFSSFRPFVSEAAARSRLDTDRILDSIEKTRLAIGNMMIKNDASD